MNTQKTKRSKTTRVRAQRFGAAIATLRADVEYYRANREGDPECHDARIAELEEAIALLASTNN